MKQHTAMIKHFDEFDWLPNIVMGCGVENSTPLPIEAISLTCLFTPQTF